MPTVTILAMGFNELDRILPRFRDACVNDEDDVVDVEVTLLLLLLLCSELSEEIVLASLSDEDITEEEYDDEVFSPTFETCEEVVEQDETRFIRVFLGGGTGGTLLAFE